MQDEDPVVAEDIEEAKILEEDENTCIDCDHTFHAGRCFFTYQTNRNFIQCQCKKGVRA